jgi:AbiEi antitoxin C-terminal domain
MVFQLISSTQFRAFEIGPHRLQFIDQVPTAFPRAKRPEWLDSMKSEAGFAKVAGIELTLLDCVRYFHKAAGQNGVAQRVRDTSAKADPRRPAKAAAAYEKSSVRRRGYLLDRAGHARQSHA